jgi:hypothetical protein
MAKKSKASLKPSRSIPVVSDEDEPVHIASETLPEPKDDAKVNKSEEIRVEAKQLMDRGEKPTPKTIVAILAQRGIKVVSPQVSQILKKMGVAQRPRRKRNEERATKPAAIHKPSSNDSFTLHELLAAKQFADMIGSPSKAKSLLDALDKIS